MCDRSVWHKTSHHDGRRGVSQRILSGSLIETSKVINQAMSSYPRLRVGHSVSAVRDPAWKSSVISENYMVDAYDADVEGYMR